MIKFIGLDVLASDIISLISNGVTETITKVKEEMESNNLVTYLNRKYKDYLMQEYENPYDICELNKFFEDRSGSEPRKLGVKREEDGLLFIVALIISELKLPKEESN